MIQNVSNAQLLVTTRWENEYQISFEYNDEKYFVETIEEDYVILAKQDAVLFGSLDELVYDDSNYIAFYTGEVYDKILTAIFTKEARVRVSLVEIEPDHFTSTVYAKIVKVGDPYPKNAQCATLHFDMNTRSFYRKVFRL